MDSINKNGNRKSEEVCIAELKKDQNFMSQTLNRIEKTLNDFINKADEKYAIKSTEEDLKDLEKQISSRNYDWLKYAIVTAIGIGITLLLAYS